MHHANSSPPQVVAEVPPLTLGDVVGLRVAEELEVVLQALLERRLSPALQLREVVALGRAQALAYCRHGRLLGVVMGAHASLHVLQAWAP